LRVYDIKFEPSTDAALHYTALPAATMQLGADDPKIASAADMPA
jgi:hypothetical protein